MKRRIVEITSFTKTIVALLKKRQLLQEDFESFKKSLAENPGLGDTIAGTGGVCKTRLKSSSGGKRGGFRVCYYDIPEKERLYLLLIYPKNEQESLTPEEKKTLKELVTILKETRI
jgi:hypothetical protein